MSIDYLETAKATLALANGDHPVERVKAWALVAIACVLVEIAERYCPRGGGEEVDE